MKVKINNAQYLIQIIPAAKNIRYQSPIKMYVKKHEYHIGWATKNMGLFKEIILVKEKNIK